MNKLSDSFAWHITWVIVDVILIALVAYKLGATPVHRDLALFVCGFLGYRTFFHLFKSYKVLSTKA